MAGLGFSVNPLGSTGSFGLPEIDPLGKGEVARRAARENEAILKQAQWQQQEAEMAAAKAKAESENQALFDAADKARAAQASTGFMDYANAAIRGAAKGYATTWDLPEIVSTAIHNFPARLLNSGFFSGDKDIYGNKWQRPPDAPPTNAVEEALAKAEAANPPEAMPLDSGQPARGPIEHIPLEDPYTPVLNDFEKAWPPAPGWERSATSDIAGVVAPVVTTLGLGAPEAGAAAAGARAGVPAVARSVAGRVATGAAKTGAITGASMGGGSVIGQLGEWLGSKVNPDFADMLKTYGETLGSAAAPEVPGLLAKLGWDAYHNLYAREAGAVDPVTGRVVRNADAARQRLNDARTAGIRVSGGNVLNKKAGLWEDASVSVPGAGNAAYDARRGQFADMGQVALDTVNSARRERGLPEVLPGQPRRIDLESQGMAARDLGQEVYHRAQEGVNYQYENPAGTGIIDRMPQGRATPLSLENQRPALQAIIDDPTVERTGQADTIRDIQHRQDANAVNVVDPALELAFQGRRASIDAMVDGPAKDAARARLAEAIQANRGPTWQTQVVQRNRTWEQDAGRTLDRDMQDRARTALTNTLGESAVQHGIPDVPNRPGYPGGFPAIEAETSRLKSQQDLLRRSGVVGPDAQTIPAPNAVQNVLSGVGGKTNKPVRDVLAEHALTPLTQYLADQAELKMRGVHAAGHPEVNPELVNPATIAQEWGSLSEEVKNMLAPTPEARARMEAGVRMMLGEQRRATRALPTRGNTMSAPQTMYTGPAIVAAVSAPAGLAMAARNAVKGLIPTVTARAYSRLMTNPANVERIVNPPTFGQSVSLPRILTNAVTSRPAQRRDVLR